MSRVRTRTHGSVGRRRLRPPLTRSGLSLVGCASRTLLLRLDMFGVGKWYAMHTLRGLGSNTEFLWTPLPSPTFSLLTGQWLDFHQLADYHASRTRIRFTIRTYGPYIQSDPIGLMGGVNTYTYVGNNPVSPVVRIAFRLSFTKLIYRLPVPPFNRSFGAQNWRLHSLCRCRKSFQEILRLSTYAQTAWSVFIDDLIYPNDFKCKNFLM